ncbi:potassium-transporting ATPase subunit KdpA [Flavihumibacter petaseus]|uniref:Potassium-transporting ATPase potassium-binding subunit n=1 Tax=Flavihumibacter petaseus NBRC 106054 TaxID=1220578 RepID=A0A0E9MU61_9BACT|nr:potassium-transporting ATPase subunit KdpA [Flavihumibacter petaseus]GAO41013.1 potassium-transporting ATPase A chain [Flavihumibacter petaseus NBRC 106054]
MSGEIIAIISIFLVTLILAWPLGKYISKVFRGERTLTDFMSPLERFIFRFSGINPNEPMSWKQFLKAMLTVNALWLFYAMGLLIYQDRFPLNPDGNAAQTPDLAFNTAISFLVNCNLQHYSGESGLTYFTQLFVITFLQFVSAATGIACLIGLFNGFRERTTNNLGNFWNYLVLSVTRILLPLSIVVAVILVFNGTPSSFAGKDTITTLQGDTVQVSRGPAAGMIAIKQLGTNGGGWFGVNSAHPLENPNYLTNAVETISILLIPIALIFSLGFYLQRRKLAVMIFGVMSVLFILFTAINTWYETKGNPAIDRLGIAQLQGSMEGKEVRIGAAATALWSVATTSTSNGSVNGMHDSLTPISGGVVILDMMINALYGGVGVGLLNFFIFIVIAVFLSGLMVGRTPEFMGHKVEAREVKIAALITLLSAFLIKGFTALAAYMVAHHPEIAWSVKPGAWLNNPSFHGFSEMLYEFTSSNANNGSGFEGLADNNIFWNVTTGIVLILGRYLPIIGPIAIVGLLANKKFIPESPGTLRTDSITFGVMTLAVIIIVTALSYLPALALGPLAEYFSLY